MRGLPLNKILSVAVLLLCMAIGLWIAQRQPLWNDEFFSLVSSVHNPSYQDMFSGRIAEGNNTPLFYVVQKLFLGITAYKYPEPWLQGNWSYVDTYSQTFLRLGPVLFVALSLALVFYFFAQKYSPWTGLLAVVVYFSSYMVWVHWAEFRPYGLVMFLSTVQFMCLDLVLKAKSNADSALWWLVVVHILLSLTSILTLGQILAASMVVWFWKHRDFKKYIFLTFLPLAIGLFYYSQAPKFQFYYDLSPEQLLRDNVSRQRFYVLMIFGVCALMGLFKDRLAALRRVHWQELAKPLPYFIFLVLTLIFTAVVMFVFGLKQTGHQGFPITSRYFIYLTPLGVFVAVWAAMALWRSFAVYPIVRLVLGLVMVFWLVQGFSKIVPRALQAIAGG